MTVRASLSLSAQPHAPVKCLLTLKVQLKGFFSHEAMYLRALPLLSHRLLFAPLYVQVSQGGGSLALCTSPALLASASPAPTHKTYLPTYLSLPQLRSTDQNVSPVSLSTRGCPLLISLVTLEPT